MGDSDIQVYSDNVDPTVEVHRLHLKEEIAEKKYQLARLKAELERFLNGQIAKMKASEIMLEREIAALLRKEEQLDRFGSQDVIDIKQVTQNGGGQNA